MDNMRQNFTKNTEQTLEGLLAEGRFQKHQTFSCGTFRHDDDTGEVTVAITTVPAPETMPKLRMIVSSVQVENIAAALDHENSKLNPNVRALRILLQQIKDFQRQCKSSILTEVIYQRTKVVHYDFGRPKI